MVLQQAILRRRYGKDMRWPDAKIFTHGSRTNLVRRFADRDYAQSIAPLLSSSKRKGDVTVDLQVRPRKWQSLA
jgi:hypothetical protein